MLEGFLISIAIFLIGIFLLALKSAIWVIGILIIIWIINEGIEGIKDKAKEDKTTIPALTIFGLAVLAKILGLF